MKKHLIFISFVLLSLGIVQNSSATTVLGNDIIARSSIDGASNINFIDPTLVFTSNGYITSWDIYAVRDDSEFALQVFRSTGVTDEYTLVGENYFANAGALNEVSFDIAAVDQIQVLTGDIMGWWFGDNEGVIVFSGSSEPVHWQSEVFNLNGHIDVGETVTFGFSGGREYSISANYTAVPVPASVWLLGSGLLALVGVARRRK